jgi:hypothetical protein
MAGGSSMGLGGGLERAKSRGYKTIGVGILGGQIFPLQGVLFGSAEILGTLRQLFI